MQIRVKAGQPDVRLDKNELRQLSKALELVTCLATYAQVGAAEDAREALAVLVSKYQQEEAGE